jgi:hypothetical protein
MLKTASKAIKGPPARRAGGPRLLSMFPITCANLRALRIRFSEVNFSLLFTSCTKMQPYRNCLLQARCWLQVSFREGQSSPVLVRRNSNQPNKRAAHHIGAPEAAVGSDLL